MISHNYRWGPPLLLAVLAISSIAVGQFPATTPVPAAIPPDRDNFHLFLLVGQSNMAGRGRVAPEDQQPHARVLMLNQQQEWVPAVAPLHFDKPKVAGVGLGRTFALDYASAHPDITVGLIPCAAGGSPIGSWEPGGYHGQTDSHPYDAAIARARTALQQGQLKGILWHQGESDSKGELAEQYAEKLRTLVSRFRSELGAPQVPFIVGQLGQFPERPWNDARRQVDAALRGLPERVACTAYVSSDGLTHKGDQVHFDAPSYRELGHRYFRAYQTLMESNQETPLSFALERSIVRSGYDGKQCWVHARAGIVPASQRKNASPLAVLTTQPLLLTGSDVFYALHTTFSHNGGRTWSPLQPADAFQRQQVDEHQELTICDFTPQWHSVSKTLLGIGQTVRYQNNRVMSVRPRATAYSTFDIEQGEWQPWKRLALPDLPRFRNAGSGSAQRVDLPGGEILLPLYFKQPDQRQYHSTICRCAFDGQTLEYLEHGTELTVPIDRGLYEPSIAQYEDRFFLTLRNDQAGYVTVSDNGLEFQPPKKWRFDDGELVGNYNTQQHWVTHSAGLFLAYTRRGADNDHVFRHRAPLFIAQVDPEKLCLLRATEQIIIPERGARLGNFGVTHVGPLETWVTVAEWMQPAGVEKHGSDNSIYVARLLWNQPNTR